MAATGTPRTSPEQVITRRLNRLINTGLPFTVDEVWRDSDGFAKGDHRNWLGRHVQALAGSLTIVCVGHKVTAASRPYSRAVPVWRGTTDQERARLMAEKVGV